MLKRMQINTIGPAIAYKTLAMEAPEVIDEFWVNSGFFFIPNASRDKVFQIIDKPSEEWMFFGGGQTTCFEKNHLGEDVTSKGIDCMPGKSRPVGHGVRCWSRSRRG